MNYRVLFLISFLILGVGLGGLFFLPSSSENTDTANTNQSAEAPVQETKPQKLITTAVLTRDLSKGSLLQAEDYALSELSVDEDNPLVENDLKQMLDAAGNQSVQGFLLNENMAQGSLLSKNTLISPQDPRFLLSTLDPKTEVAYRIYIASADAYLLDTVRVADNVAVFSQQTAKGVDSADRNELIKVIDKVSVLYSKAFSDEEAKAAGDGETVGYITVKADAAQVQKLYSVVKDAKLIVLPSEQQDSVNHRGMFIRKLRGQ
ncbi:pilus assembly protein CpaB [Mesocricetibacter intestinalis]|uniref:Pilus assembly protein CpaB n=1 Tax=Mesocricetibacter intestinalis TaxID=1521930 RepID=A0A4R6VC23_9PAST|nr:SAF domain-containing protein [Mesocricetibacter intestinalis]TDQ57639.1 pilus assembly protein CpaB [Mesocricetibacter intestinalis]